jgi:hypothetical protein
MNTLNQQLGVAEGIESRDASQNTQGWNSGTALASDDTARRNDAQQNFNNAGIGMWTGTTPAVVNTQAQRNNAGAAESGAISDAGVAAAETFMTAVAGGATGGGGAAGGGGGAAGAQAANYAQMANTAQSLGGGQQQQSLDPWERY